MKISTHWLRDFVTLAPPLERIADRLTLAGLEVKKIEPAPDKKDMIFEIEITTNRPDWLSHWGVAREIAAVENLSLKGLQIDKNLSRAAAPGWKVNLKEAEGCSYYTGVYIEGIAPNLPTPDFIKERLDACGVRSISLLVDITNYVLLETGQPLHAFDADLLKGQEVQIRRARPQEKFIAINGASYTLETGDLVIADADRPVALAGIMGGKDSEVTERTRNVFLESAFFHPRWVRQSSRRLNLASDSSYRFERRVDPEGVDAGRDRALTLIMQYAKPRFVSAPIKAGQAPAASKSRIHLSLHEVEKRLGFKLKSSQVVSILTRLQLDAKIDSQESVNVAIPSFRPDLLQPIDLIEEIARIHGYDEIPETLPSRPLTAARKSPQYELEKKIGNFLVNRGLFETVTFSLISAAGLDPEKDLKNAVFVNNPQNSELVWMRPTMLPSLSPVLQRNFRGGQKGMGLFEIAHLYRAVGKEKKSEEEKTLAIALSGIWKQKSWMDQERKSTFYDLKGLVQSLLAELGVKTFAFEEEEKSLLLHPGTERIQAGNQNLGYLGEVQPQVSKHWDLEEPVYYAEISLPKLLSVLGQEARYQEIARYPAIERDFSLQVKEEVKAGKVESMIRKLGGSLVSHVELFDLFRGGRVPAGCKNLAFRVTYQSAEKTLLSEEIQKLHTDIAAKIVKEFQASFQ